MITPSVSGRLAAFACALLVLGLGPSVSGSTLGEAIAEKGRIETCQHYLEELLYTRLGDDRGFGPEHDLARDNIFDTLQSFGLSVELEPFQFGGNTYYNVVATQVGLDSPDDIVVLGAHFDSANNPGADDNGTGTALVMETARVLSQHRSPSTVKYVLFDREEQGLVGSSAFVNAHEDENIVMALAIDMVGHDSGLHGVDIYGAPASAVVVDGIDAAIDTYGDDLGGFVNIGDHPISDHWPFESAGIPASVVVESCYWCNPYYHTPNDAVDVEPGYISYPMLEDLMHSVLGYLVDTVGITVWGDVNTDGAVDVLDLVEVVLSWGPCEPDQACPADVNDDGFVDVEDLVFVIVHWG